MADFILSHYQSEIRNNLSDDSLIHNQLDETTCLMEINYIIFQYFTKKNLLKLFQKSALEALSNRNLQCLWKKSRVFCTILWRKPWDKGMFGWSISSAPLLSKTKVQLVVVFSLKMTSRLWRVLTLQWLSKTHKTKPDFFWKEQQQASHCTFGKPRPTETCNLPTPWTRLPQSPHPGSWWVHPPQWSVAWSKTSDGFELQKKPRMKGIPSSNLFGSRLFFVGIFLSRYVKKTS